MPKLAANCRIADLHGPTIHALSALLLVFVGNHVHAQTSSADETGAGSGNVLQEIIVTAQYREQNLQQTPLAVTAIEADEIVARSMDSVLDVSVAAPNVTMTPATGEAGNSNQAFIRAIGRQDSDFAFEPRVSFYIDDVYHATVYGSIFDLLDVERIEILRGPQGTLFGRNAVGGAVRIVTRKPDGKGGGYVSATVGNFDRFDLSAAADIGLVPDSLFLRLSAGHQQRDGHVDRLNFACLYPEIAGNLPVAALDNGCRVGTLGGIDLTNGRAALRWVFGDDAETTFTFEYLNDDREPQGAPTLALSLVNELPGLPPDVPSGLALWLATIGVPAYGLTISQALLDALQPRDSYQSYASFGNPGLANPLQAMVNKPVNSLESWSISNVFDWQFNDSIRFKSITAYREFEGAAGQSVMALPITEIHYLASHRQFSQEFRLSGNAFDDRLEWTIGTFYLDSRNRHDGRIQLEGFSAFIPGPDIAVPVIFDFFADDRSMLESKSVFAHTVWRATDRLNITLGARYTDEIKGYDYFRQNVGEPPNNTASAPDTGISEFTPRLAVDYQWTPDLLAYVSYATGFTAGGFNPRPFTPEDAELSFGTETAATYEIGMKSEWLDHRLRINVAAFFTEFDDVQLLIAGCPVGCRTTSPFYYDNVGDSEIKGIEIEFLASPLDGLMISGFIGSQESSFVRFKDDAFPLEVALDGPTFKVPEWNGGLSIQYEADLGARGSLIPRLDATYRSTAYFGGDRDSEVTRQDGFALFNASITWRAADDGWSAALTGTNLTDKVYFHNIRDRRNFLGYADGQVARPREWSASVTYRF